MKCSSVETWRAASLMIRVNCIGDAARHVSTEEHFIVNTAFV